MKIFLLTVFVILQYEEVIGYPQYNAENNSRTMAQISFIERPISDLSKSRLLRSTSILPYVSDAFNDTFDYIKKKLEILETSYEQLTKYIKEFIEGKNKNSKKDEKDQSSSLENTVSNNKTQENIITTTSTPNKSTDTSTADKLTNTQKPAPAKHDDKKNKPGDKKDPLNTSETTSNNKIQENVTQTTPEPVKSTTIQEPTKNDREKEPAEDEKDSFIPIKNNKDENMIAITNNEDVVSEGSS